MPNCPEVTIVDYEIGNLFNLKRALEYAGGRVEITFDPLKIASAQRLVLSGVGAFGKVMEHLTSSGMADAINKFVKNGRPLLGICLGMQILMGKSCERGVFKGLNLINGEVVRLDEPTPGGPPFKIPHVGWARLEFPEFDKADKDSNLTGRNRLWDKTILRRLNRDDYFYFVHSYYAVLDDFRYVFAQTKYGKNRFCSVLAKDNIYGCQFHPEKSGEKGLGILREFLFNP